MLQFKQDKFFNAMLLMYNVSVQFLLSVTLAVEAIKPGRPGGGLLTFWLLFASVVSFLPSFYNPVDPFKLLLLEMQKTCCL